MSIEKLENTLSDGVCKALEESFESICRELSNETLYGYQILAAGDFNCCVIVAATLESFERVRLKYVEIDARGKELFDSLPDSDIAFKPTPDSYLEIWASEWEYYYTEGQSLASIFDIGQSIFDLSDEIELDTSKIFESAFTKGILKFKEKNNKARDLFIGFQVADPDDAQAKVVENILLKVNVPKWHSKISGVYSSLAED